MAMEKEEAKYLQTETDYVLFCRGDMDAFARIVYQYRAPVTAFITRLLHQTWDAEDLAADVFVELLEHPRRFRCQSSLKTYLFTIARHKTVDFLRRISRCAPADLAASDLSMPPLDNDPELHLLAAEKQREMQAAWKGIREEYRLALYLTAVEELSYEEAAQVMNKSKRQIRDFCYLGRQELRRQIKAETE